MYSRSVHKYTFSHIQWNFRTFSIALKIFFPYFHLEYFSMNTFTYIHHRHKTKNWCPALMQAIWQSLSREIRVQRRRSRSEILNKERKTLLASVMRRKIRLIESNAKYRYLKKLPVKGLCGRCFICLRPRPLLWGRGPPMTPYSPPPLHTVYVYTSILIHTGKGEGGELTREKGRGAIL